MCQSRTKLFARGGRTDDLPLPVHKCHQDCQTNGGSTKLAGVALAWQQVAQLIILQQCLPVSHYVDLADWLQHAPAARPRKQQFGGSCVQMQVTFVMAQRTTAAAVAASTAAACSLTRNELLQIPAAPRTVVSRCIFLLAGLLIAGAQPLSQPRGSSPLL